MVPALLTGAIPPPSPSSCYHRSAASLDFPAPPVAAKIIEKRPMRVGLLTVSDRASQGIYKDESGPEMEKLLGKFIYLLFIILYFLISDLLFKYIYRCNV
jgi:hypothetical protein